MSEPLTTECAYCGSPDVLDDAWFCARPECWKAYEAEATAAIRERYHKVRRAPVDPSGE